MPNSLFRAETFWPIDKVFYNNKLANKMRIILSIVLVFISSCGPQPTSESDLVEYKITPQRTNFLVEIKFNTRPQLTILRPPEETYSQLTQLPGTADYPLRYEITPKSSQPTIADTVIELDRGFFQTPGQALLTCVDKPDITRPVKIIWNTPPDWKIANSFSADQKEQYFRASCNNLAKALYVGGRNFKLAKTAFGALAISGSLNKLTASTLEKALEHNMSKVHQFWGTSSAGPYYFVSIRGTKKNSTKKHGGSAWFQAFQLDLPLDQTTGPHLDHLITHEYFHNWNGLKINLPLSADHLDVWWFVEGFTDYYAYKLTYSEAPEDYARSFHVERFRNESLFELKRNFKNNADYFQIPYVQGRRIAAQLDLEMNGRLANVMHEIIRRSEQDPLFYLTQENILSVICVGGYMRCERAREMIENHVIHGLDF